MVSPQNPLKPAGQQAPELDRFSMAFETACAASKYPDKIKPSVIEFMLDKPSYTIHTLRHLTENYDADAILDPDGLTTLCRNCPNGNSTAK